jgi:hypothetical protein
MAVFVAASDESSGKTKRDPYYFAGWVAPEEDWSRFFAPAWQERVLDGPPKIPYLHMTEMRSAQWRSQWHLSKLQAEDRIDEAFRLIDTMATLYPVGITVDAGQFRDKFSKTRVVKPGNRVGANFDPDYICFLGYAFVVLQYVAHNHPEAKKVDFVIERNGQITQYIKEFHSQLPQCLQALNEPALSRLVGELIPGGKDRVPLQAADVLCWHTARPRKLMDSSDVRRYAKLAHRKGIFAELTDEQISQIEKALVF